MLGNKNSFSISKGQLISNCPFDVILDQNTKKKFTNPALEFEKWSNHKIKALYNVFND